MSGGQAPDELKQIAGAPYTALMLATMHGHARVVKFLVLSGAGLPIAKLHRAHALSLRSSRPKLSNVDANIAPRRACAACGTAGRPRRRSSCGGSMRVSPVARHPTAME